MHEVFHAAVKAHIIVPFRHFIQVDIYMLETLLNAIAAPAYAAEVPAGAPQGGSMSFLLMFAIFFVFIYFAIWRPQNKRAREQQSMLSSLAKGDEVMTAGGLIGRITKLGDQFITVSVASNVDLMLQKSSVVNVLPKGTIKSIE